MSKLNNHNPHGREGVLYSTGTIPTRHVYKTLVLSLFLTCLSFVLLPTIIATANATDQVSGDITWAPITLTLDTGGNVEFGSITPSVNNGTNLGTMVVAKKTVKIASNGKAARVYLSTDSNTENDLVLSGTSISIPAVTGTWDAPTTFSGKGWGFAVPDKTVSGTTRFSTAFASDYSYDTTFGISANSVSAQLQSGDSGYNEQTWAAVPKQGAEKKIYDVTSTVSNGLSEDNSLNNFDIYYAIMADETLIAGTYARSVVYTAIASADSLSTASNNLSVVNANSNGVNMRTKRFANAGDTLNLRFDLAENNSGLIKKDNTTVYLVPHQTVVDANYNLATIKTNSNLSALPVCAIGSGASDFVISDNTEGDGINGANINCVVPSNVASSDSSSAITIADSSNSDAKGFYDVWVKIMVNNEEIDYLSKFETNQPSVVFAGLQSKYDGEYVVSTMQDMTAEVCNYTNEWGTGYGAGARVYDYTGSGTTLADSASASAAIGTGTFLLADSRDDKTYLVRRLADGNCWMVQNLAYDLTKESNRKLSPDTSDVEESKTLSQKNLLDEIGSNCSAQYQGLDTFGTDCKWGSTKGGISATNNADAGFARSYNNDLGYIEGTSNTSNPTECANVAGDSSVFNMGCAMSGRRDNTSTIVSRSGYAVNDTKQDTTWQPELITNSDGDTFTMRGSMYYGSYYNWYAATAESGKYNMNGNANATDSICPKGWQLPINGGTDTDKSWQHLVSGAYGYNVVNGSVRNGYYASNRAALNKIMQLPTSVPFAGCYEWTGGALNARGRNGTYWSSTATAADESKLAHRFYMYYDGYFDLQTHDQKTYGFSIRCVAR